MKPAGLHSAKPLVERTLRRSRYEGAAYAFMVGLGETYFLADALHLGASRVEQGLMAALPLFFGSLGPLLVLRLLASFPHRRLLVAGSAATQVLVLTLLACGNAGGWLSLPLLIASVCLYQICAQGSGAAWGSWFGDLVPAERRGRYFSSRNLGVYGGTFSGLLLGGGLLQSLELGPESSAGRGFAVIFALAACFRALSCWMLLRSFEPRYRGLPRTHEARRFFATKRGHAARRVLLPVAALYAAVYLASPYFTPYMLEELHFSYLEYMLAAAAVSTLKICMLPFWGRAIDRRGPRAACALAAVLLALIPVPWLWARGLGWVLFAQAFSGSCWAGFEVAHFTVLLESSYRRTRPYVLAASSLLNGMAQLLGSLAGALLVELWLHDLRLLFAVGIAARLTTAGLLAASLPSDTSASPHRRWMLRIVGVRPNRGVALQPMLEEVPTESERTR